MSVLDKVIHYQKKIERNKEHTETLMHCINKLNKLPITVRHLEKTGIGKTINELRKLDGDVGNAVKALVWKWKRVVFVETVAEEHAKKVKGLTNPIVSNSDETVLNAVKTEEKKEPTHRKEDTNTLCSAAGNDTEMLQEIYQNGYISSITNLNYNVSDYENLRCETLPQSTKGENKTNSPTESHVFAIHQSSSKTEKQKHSHHRRHRSKHHTRKRRNNQKHNLKSQEVHSELKIKEDGIKIKLEKVNTKNKNKQKEKHCSKQAENETKYKEKKCCRKERGQKRKTGLSEIFTENIPKQSKTSEKVKDKMVYDDNIDYFGEALQMGDALVNKRSSSTTALMRQNSDSKSSPNTKTTNLPFNSLREIIPIKPDLSLADVKLQSLDVEIDLVLSEMAPNYNPLSYLPLMVKAPTLKKEAKQAPLSKQHRQRMKVYSGVKTGRVPTLYDLSVHVLKENIDALEYTGGVPYDILKPILQQATPEQLFHVEYHNPYLIEDTNELWEFHCRKEFRSGQLQPMETAREMYLRCLDEREAKLKALTGHIQQSLIKSSVVRKTKLAYVDSDPKPPRNVAKEQAHYGTGSIQKSDIEKSQISMSILMPLTSTVTSRFIKKSTNATAQKKPCLAPLMKKTMKLAKSFKR